MSIIIDIAHHADIWPDDSESIIQTAIHAALKTQTITEAEASVVLADNDFAQTLNKQYRGKDKPTNVLSFPQTLPLLGDIVLAYETLESEAREQSKNFNDHLTHLTVHGTLHLLGYDHETDSDAEEMEALEVEILHELGIKNPYENA